eukprot:964825-Amphidinium_carterae.1
MGDARVLPRYAVPTPVVSRLRGMLPTAISEKNVVSGDLHRRLVVGGPPLLSGRLVVGGPPLLSKLCCGRRHPGWIPHRNSRASPRLSAMLRHKAWRRTRHCQLLHQGP